MVAIMPDRVGTFRRVRGLRFTCGKSDWHEAAWVLTNNTHILYRCPVCKWKEWVSKSDVLWMLNVRPAPMATREF